VRATHSGDSPAEMGSSAWPAMAAMATVPGAPWAAQRRKGKGKAKLGEGRGGCGDAHRRANRAGVAWSRRSTRELCPVPKQGRWKSERGGTRTASWVAWRALGWRRQAARAPFIDGVRRWRWRGTVKVDGRPLMALGACLAACGRRRAATGRRCGTGATRCVGQVE
jgi:hypothetical protein